MIRVLFALFVLLLAACGSSSSATDPGRGECDELSFIDTRTKPLPLSSSASACYGGPDGLRQAVSISNSDTCVCETPSSIARPDGKTSILDAEAQIAYLDRKGINDIACGPALRLVDGQDCYKLGYVNGFMQFGYARAGGDNHDGDDATEVCPFESGVHDGVDPRPGKGVDVRGNYNIHSLADGGGLPRGPVALSDVVPWEPPGEYARIHVENQWCRWYIGRADIQPFPGDKEKKIPALGSASFDKFRPEAGERVSMVGDWVLDGRKTELHEVRMMSVLRKDPNHTDVYHLLTSGFFAADTVQDRSLSITIPVPFAQDSSLGRLECEDAGTLCAFNDLDGNEVTRIAYAGDVRAIWVDPQDQWRCSCQCDDPSQPGAVIFAPVHGCAPAGLEPERPADIRKACEAACGGLMCGEAPSCRIGQCRPWPLSEARLVAREGCFLGPPPVRVTEAGDYLVRLDYSASMIDVGRMKDGKLEVDATARIDGLLYINDNKNAADPRLDFADFEVVSDDFVVPVKFLGFEVDQVSVRGGFSFITHRVSALYGPRELSTGETLGPNAFLIPPGALRIGVSAVVNGASGGTELGNEGPATGTFNLASNTFTFDVIGSNPSGQGVRAHLVGTVVNHPPVANPGPDKSVECQSPTTTAVVLDGSASSDPDPGDVLSHFQWFESGAGRGNQKSVILQVALGSHDYALHVNDQRLASHHAVQRVRVVDTTPPTLTVTVNPVCLWPPNHRFALFRLGEQIRFTSQDKCDPSPEVYVKSIVSNEAADAPGSGSTDPDAVAGRNAGCVRAERAGTGTARSYTVTLEAVDDFKNKATATVEILVPHDLSQHPGCARAEGIDALDSRCLE